MWLHVVLIRKGVNKFQVNQTLPWGDQWGTALFWNKQTGLCFVLAELATLTQVSVSVMLNNQTNVGTWNAQVSLLHKYQHRKAR